MLLMFLTAFLPILYSFFFFLPKSNSPTSQNNWTAWPCSLQGNAPQSKALRGCERRLKGDLFSILWKCLCIPIMQFVKHEFRLFFLTYISYSENRRGQTVTAN